MKKLQEEAQEALALIRQAQAVTVLTGSGISASVGIPTLESLGGLTQNRLLDLDFLQQEPEAYWHDFRLIFLAPIFEQGPSLAHRVLAKMETQDLIQGIVTTNVDYLHELAGSHRVYNIWWDLNHNRCENCGRIYPLDVLRAAVPRCPDDGSLLIPESVYHQLGTDAAAVAGANTMMAASDLTLVVGCNGYYSRTGSKVININPVRNGFDKGAALVVRADADAFFVEIEKYLGASA